MYCENCNLRVETDWSTYFEWTDREEFYYGDIDHSGEHHPSKAGEIVGDEHEFKVGVRVDFCGNCACALSVRTFGRPQ